MIFGFVVLTVILVGIILYFSAGKAIIKITPKATKVETDFVVDVVSDGGGADKNIMQGVLFETEVNGSIEGEATGSQILAGSSIGKVILINKRAEAQTLVKTTRLLTQDGILLRLMDKVIIPAGGQIEAAVYADNPNAFDELPPTTFTIPGLWEGLQTQVYAESKVALKSTGDAIKVIKAVDIARTNEDLTEILYKKAIEQFNQQLPNQNYVSLVVSKKVIEEKITGNVDEVKDKLMAEMKLGVVIIGLEQSKIIDLAGERLRSVVEDGQALAGLNAGNFAYKVESFDSEKKTAKVKIHVEGEAVVKAENPIFDKEKISGLSPKGVELYLANFKEVEAVSVELSPFWVKKVPKLKDHINIVVINPNK